LFRNVVKAAWNQLQGSTAASALASGWKREPEFISKTFHFDSYSDAVRAVASIDDASTMMDHHANMSFVHKCSSGVDVELKLFTYDSKTVTEKDYAAAKTIDSLIDDRAIEMKKFSYNLLEESIAKFPANPRGSSKLLYVNNNGDVSYATNFSESFPSLAEGCHIVFNESRVVEARLFLQEQSNHKEKLEMMILDLGNVELNNRSASTTPLEVMLRREGVEKGALFQVATKNETVQVVVDESLGEWLEDEKSDGNGTRCMVRILSEDSVAEFLEKEGSVPIPPYLQRAAESLDKERYNNVYAKAKQAGSVAAPTAGLHFTPTVLEKIGMTNCSYLTLHVGAGTFQPVLVEDARDHRMHGESFGVSVYELKNIIKALEDNKPLIAVGTTSCRTLESLFWLGVKRIRGMEYTELGQKEWMALRVGEGSNLSRTEALKVLVADKDDGDIIHGRTSLMIAPPNYEFQVIDHLVTNFHAPDSTLMLLVSAFFKDKDGELIRRIYEDAQDSGYRFLSYGDVCFFKRQGLK